MRVGCDLNVLQGPDLLNQLITDPSLDAVLADVSIAELCKHADWKRTIGLAMGHLQPHLNKISLAIPVSEIMKIELHNRELLAASDLIDTDLTVDFRQLVLDLSSTANMESVDEVDKNFSAFREQLLAEELDSNSARKRMTTIVEPYLDLKPKLRKALNGKDADIQLLDCYAQISAKELTISYLNNKHQPSEHSNAEEFVEKKPLLMRHLYLLIHYGVNLALRGRGWNERKHQKDVNDFLDIDHVLTGSYCDGFLSDDAAAKEAYESLKRMLQRSNCDAADYISHKFRSLNII